MARRRAAPAARFATLAWPGANAVTTVDATNAFTSNLSGLYYEAGSPTVLWAVLNGPGTIFKLVFDGTIWTSSTADGWTAGKVLHYPGGTGGPDSEGITRAEAGSSAIYVSTERDNNASSVSRPAILRFDTSVAGTELTATNDWNLTADLPVLGSNLGLEGITWIPDTFLTAGGFIDDSTGLPYTPASYANHGTGLFFVGVEASGISTPTRSTTRATPSTASRPFRAVRPRWWICRSIATSATSGPIATTPA